MLTHIRPSKQRAGGRHPAIRIGAGTLCACLSLTTLVHAQPFTSGADDKISPAILAHHGQKIRPPGLTAAQHSARLRSLGLNPDHLQSEQVALYVQDRLSEQDIDQLRGQGIDINPSGWVPAVDGRHAHAFHLAVVRYDSLDVLRQDDRFTFVESVESLMYPTNLAARVMINADDVSNGNGVSVRTATGVKVAIADSGIDLSHPDFPTPVEAFDMTDGTDPSTWGTDVSNTVMDHGTHVTGSALGRGVLGPYQGAADGAALYFYKIGDDLNAAATDADMIEAINRFVAVAGSGPRVFSLSYGGFSSPHLDGSGPVCQAIDNATAAGVTCFVAAGNEANSTGLYPWATDRHDSMSVAPGAMSGTFNILVDNSSGTTPYTGVEDLRVLWRDGVIDDNLALNCTNCFAGEFSFQWSGPSPRTTEARQYWIDLSLNPLPAGQSRTYTLRLQNNAGGGATPLVHVYRYGGIGRFTSPDSSYTIQHPGVADTAITVGAWVQANAWLDFQGSVWQYTWLSTNTLAPFSSLGPRIDGAQKPDLAAPGAVTFSTMDSGTFGSPSGCNIFSGFPLTCLTIDNDGFNNGAGPADYYAHFGTSMATPMAAGAAALMLEAAPTMTPAEARAALAATAANAGAPDNNAGAGLIDILAAIQSVDCDDNGVYDVTELADGSAADCDGNSRPDACDIADGTLTDCNANAAADLCDISSGSSDDCNSNIVPDECDLAVGPLEFGSEINSGIGTNFIGKMFSGRFDGDGDLDLIYLTAGTLHVTLGNGNNTFNYLGQFDGAGVNPVQALDVDGDGDDDLLGSAFGFIPVALCNGDGTFATPVDYPTTQVDGQSVDAAVADMDRDGVLDLVVVENGFEPSSSGITIYPGQGNGTFGTGVLHSAGAFVRSVALGDLDNDGYVDVASAINSVGDNQIAVMLNNGDGTLASPSTNTVGITPLQVAIADVDADGDLDLAVVNANDFQTSNNDLSVLLNNGDGTFAAAVHVDVAAKSRRIMAADFDLDGVSDIAVGHWNDFSRLEQSVVLSNGDGTFAAPVHITPPTQFIGGSAFGDFDNDGDPDWAFHQAFQASVLPNVTQSPTEADCNVNGLPDGCDISSGASADCQSDGIPDDCQVAGGDCNGNGVPDVCDVSGGGSMDTNLNGLPDECESAPCPADFNGDGFVNAADLAQLLGNWGSTSGCPPHLAQDLNQDCDVDAADLALLLGAWGPC